MNKIDKIPAGNPFKVPEGYFEEVNRKIISVTSGKRGRKSESGFYYRIRPYLLAAASVAGFLVLSYTASRIITVHRVNQPQVRIINDDNYSPYLNDLDIYSIEENSGPVTIPDQRPDVSNSEIIDYLMLENIETIEIYEQL
jgi:hypothetical protein